MKIDIIGCGDAYDGEHTNASLLLSESQHHLLVDCGPWVPKALFCKDLAVDTIDTIYITHAHPDHCLGLTTLLNWMDSRGRTKPLTLIAQQKQFTILDTLVSFAHWPQQSLGFTLHWVESEQCRHMGPWTVITSRTRHSVSNRSICLTSKNGQLFYSGDGLLTAEGEELAAHSDIVFVECEELQHHKSHGSWQAIKPLVRKRNSTWFLYHIDPRHRSTLAHEITDIPEFFIAEENSTHYL